MMETTLTVYKVNWKSTISSYIACVCTDLDKVKEFVRNNDDRCDSIKNIEEACFLGESKEKNKVKIYTDLKIF